MQKHSISRKRLAIFNIKEPSKAAIRMMARARQLKPSRVSVELKSARIVAILTVKNETPRLPYLLDYYRKIGIDHFLIIDNNSNDGLPDLLLEEHDVTVYNATGSYRDARYGNDWVNFLLTLHCRNKWVLYVDADELFTWDTQQASTLQQLCDELEYRRVSSAHSLMVDMYSRHSGGGNSVDVGQDPLDVCDLFEPDGYEQHFDPLSLTTWIKGGVRGRVFFPEDIWQGPALNKTPLVHWKIGYFFIQSSHKLWPRKLNRQSTSATTALLHFKFTSLGVSKMGSHSNKEQHSDEYRAYDQAILEVDLSSASTKRYTGPNSLIEAGLMSEFNVAPC